MIWKLGAGAAGVAALAGLEWLMWSPAGTAGLIPYTDSAAIARGAEVYAAQCASCHGADLGGEEDWRNPDADGYMPAPPHDETGHTWHHPDAQLIAVTRFGTEKLVGNGYKSRMAGFGESLSDADILAVLAYIKSTWPEQVIDTHNRINADAGD